MRKRPESPACGLLILFSLIANIWLPASHADDSTKKVVLIAGPKSHGPVGNGIHDYPWSVKLLKVMLDNSNIHDKVRVEIHLDGWPADPHTLDDADTIMVISDGRDGDKYAEAPHFASEEHLAVIAKQMARGCGFLTFHFSTFAPDKYADQILSWSGGYFDWEENGERKWYSAINTRDAEIEIASPRHPVAHGLQPFKMNEEFYYNLRFRPDDKALQPILVVPSLPGRAPDGKTVAWARERTDGGRGFGTTCGHFYENWKQEQFRKLILNAIAWTAKLNVPAQGVDAKFYTHAEITTALAGIEGTTRAVLDDKPIKVLILTGHQYPGHKWAETTPVIKDALARDPRMQVDVSNDIEVLATPKIFEYGTLVLNYCNWEKPGLTDAAKVGFVKYLNEGGGLSIIHFANGAFHFSLPKAGDSDWPEYRKICRRVWDHTKGKSGHDSYGKFIVDLPQPDHPITSGMTAFETIDELYFRQQGDEPIDVVATARSQVTGMNEPLAFVYNYGKGRVFQTVLGHGADSLRGGTAELVRRGTTWSAGRKSGPLPVIAAVAAPAKVAAPTNHKPLDTGKFGQALNAHAGGAITAGKPGYTKAPLTVECWAKLDRKQSYNILIANELKSSATHWEVFTMPGTGFLTVYLPGMQPDHVSSKFDVCDGAWHYIAMTFASDRVKLFVNGKQVAEQMVKSKGGMSVAGGLAFGTLVAKEIGCSGLVDEVRLSSGLREIKGLPTTPFELDAQTLGLWHFDAIDAKKQFQDESPQHNPALQTRLDTQAPVPKQAKRDADHFGAEAVGFRWTEQNSVDNRWNQSDIGRFLASSIPLPGGAVQKGLSIRVGDKGDAAVCYDTGSLVLRAAWDGKFLAFDPARFGIISSPRVAGKFRFATLLDPGWGIPAHWSGLSVSNQRVTLTYEVAGVPVRESPWLETHADQSAITRTVEFGPTSAPLTMPIARLEGTGRLSTIDGIRVAGVEHAGHVTAVAVTGHDSVQLSIAENSRIGLTIPPHAEAIRFKLLIWSGVLKDLPSFAALAKASPPPLDLQVLSQPGAAQWKAPITTRGTTGTSAAPYVLDTLTIPFENPYRALMFISGHDFFSNGDIAACTIHGDVWRISGVDERLEKLTWKRYATGLFQPLGLKIVGDIVHVVGRDQITKLHDQNSDGEADRYENFNNAYATSLGGHDYVGCLESDAAGNFYFVHATQGLVKVSPDGSRTEIVASGFRNPNGLGVRVDGTATVSPQEGNWTPASCIVQVQPGGYYGYGGPRVTSDRPVGYDPPLCWIPRLQDNSSGGQTWVDSDRWGPLKDQLLHFSFGKCRMLLALRESVDGKMQGGTVDFPLDFDSGIMRGRFHPRDGQLYVSGLKGWVSSAVRDGCLQRVRFTGRKVEMPASVRTLQNGLAITFTAPLDPATAEDPDNYNVQRWNYLYSGNYGSAEYKVSDSRQEGRDNVRVRSATLLDPRTVFLELDDMRPVMQMGIGYTLQAADKSSLRQTIYYTLNAVGKTQQDQKLLTRRASPGQLPPAVEADLQPGLIVRFQQRNLTDARASRLAAISVPAGASPTPFLEPGPFTARFEGYIQVPLKETYRFGFTGNGDVTLTINGQTVLQKSGDLSRATSQPVALHKGFNQLAIQYASPGAGHAGLRLMWETANVANEPVPPTSLFSSGSDTELLRGNALRKGRELFATQNCFQCHRVDEGATAALSTAHAMPELQRDAPRLETAGSRLNPDWVAQWLLEPRSLRNNTTMPQLFDILSPTSQQQAADIAAYLGSLTSSGNEQITLQSAASAALVTQGEILYEDLGCMACHRLTPPKTNDAIEGFPFQRTSLHYVGAKFRTGALASFLRMPQRHYAWSPMPDFRLSDNEAEALAAFLTSSTSNNRLPEGVSLPAGDKDRGREAFRLARCGNCHAVDQTGPPSTKQFSTPLPRMAAGRGCLAEEPGARKNSPTFSLTAADRTSLAAFLQTDRQSLGRDSTAEASQRLAHALKCAACHPRDLMQSPRGLILADEGSRGIPPETLPNLTWAGEKLHASWTARQLGGKLNYRSRPWLTARMPAFPSYATALATGLAAEHGISDAIASPASLQPELAETGRRLTLKDTGLDCRQCHAVGRDAPQGDKSTQIAQGINFVHIRERMRHDYYQRFLLDPPRFDIGSKMPKLANELGKTKLSQYYDGDASRQFGAVWSYIQSLPPIVDQGTSPAK